MEEQKKKTANPAPLGLLGFGMTTILLNLYNSGILKERFVMIAAMGIAMGGLAQIIAGLIEFKLSNTFGGTAFTAYGCFWWSLILIWWNPIKQPPVSTTAMGFYLLIWGIFTTFMFIGTFKHNTISKIIFGSLALLFFMLAIGDFADSSIITKIAGVIGIICGLSAVYSAAGQIINAEFGKKILPL